MNKESKVKTSIEVLDQLAETRREKIRNEVSNETVPDFLLMISQTEISYVIEPTALPYSQIDLEDFSNRLNHLYKVKPEEQSIQQTGNQLDNLLHRNRQVSALSYTDCRFELSDRDFIEIKAIRFTRERIHIVLKGPSVVAEAILADCIETLWSCAGVNKKFEELASFIQLKEYGTATKVRLKVKLEKVISPGLINLLENDCVKGKKYAQHSAPKSYLDKFELNSDLIASFAVDDIDIRFNIFDPVTGDSNQTKLRFTVAAKSEYGKGVYTVISELPYELHMELINDFVLSHQ